MSNRAELPLKAAPPFLAGEQAVCPNCSAHGATVVGRLGLRLVFNCVRCSARFHRHPVDVRARAGEITPVQPRTWA